MTYKPTWVWLRKEYAVQLDTKAVNKFADIKGNQVMDAMEAIGCIFGGGKKQEL